MTHATYEEMLEVYAEDPGVIDKLKGYLSESIPIAIRDSLALETKCFTFYFQHGKLRPNHEFMGIDGKVGYYPDLDKFTIADWSYLENRLQSASNSFLRSRYAHLLYIHTKHHQFSRQAITAYLDLTNIYFTNIENEDSVFPILWQVLECYHHLSVATNQDLASCKSHLLFLLNNEKSSTLFKHTIIEIILNSPLFKKNDLKGMTAFTLSQIDLVKEHYTLCEMYLKTCLRLAKREGVTRQNIYSLLGSNELRLSNSRKEDETGLIQMQAYQNAANYFKLAKDETQRKSALLQYEQQKQKINLKSFSVEFSSDKVNEHNKQLNDIVDHILSKGSIAPYAFIVYNDDLLKDEQELLTQAKSEVKNSPFYYATMITFDINNNSKTLTEEEKISYQKNQSFSLHLQFFTLPLLDKLLYKGIRIGKISTTKIFDFLNSTWFSQPLDETDTSSTITNFSWMELLSRGLYDILWQLEAQILDSNYTPNIQLAIDSLSIKIEGIIRDLAKIAGIPTIKNKESETAEMTLEDLLREPSVAKLFETRDLFLFKFLLTKQGWNLRNNIAHSFFRPKDYSPKKGLLLLLVIFRLCKYESIVSSKLAKSHTP